MVSLSTITKTVKRRSRGASDSRQMHATREWAIGLLGFTVIVVAGSFYLWWLYQSYSNTTFISETEVNSVSIYQASLANQATEIITERQEIFKSQFGDIATPIIPASSIVNDTPIAASNDSSVDSSVIEESPAAREEGEEEIASPTPLSTTDEAATSTIDLLP